MDKLEQDRKIYHNTFWKHTDDWTDIVLSLEAHYEEIGLLKELQKPIKKKERVYKPYKKPEYKKVAQKKHYNHLGIGIDSNNWKVPTKELEEKEDEWCAENYEYILQTK